MTATTAAGPTKRLSLSGGWHTLVWSEPKRAGFYGVHVSAVDWAGNRTAFDTLPIVRVPGTASKAAATRGTAAARTAGPPPLAVGAAVADPGQASAVLAAGFRLVRFGVTWPAGAAAPDPGLVVALQRVPSRLGIVVDLYAVPVDDAGRAALAQYVASLVQQVPSIRDILLAPTPTVATAASYVSTLAALRNALVPTGIPVAVGPLIDGARGPAATITAIAAAGVAADVVGFKPAPAAGKNLWTTTNLPQLTSALEQAFGAGPSVAGRRGGGDELRRRPHLTRRVLAVTAGRRTRPVDPGQALTGRGRGRSAWHSRLSWFRGRRRRNHTRSRRHPRSTGANSGRPRLLPRLPVPRHARESRRHTGRRHPGCATRWRAGCPDHPRAEEPWNSGIRRRRQTRGSSQPRGGHEAHTSLPLNEAPIRP